MLDPATDTVNDHWKHIVGDIDRERVDESSNVHRERYILEFAYPIWEVVVPLTPQGCELSSWPADAVDLVRTGSHNHNALEGRSCSRARLRSEGQMLDALAATLRQEGMEGGDCPPYYYVPTKYRYHYVCSTGELSILVLMSNRYVSSRFNIHSTIKCENM